MAIKVYHDLRRMLSNGQYAIYLRVTADDGKTFLINTSITARYKVKGCRFDLREYRRETKSQTLAARLKMCKDFMENNPDLPSDELKTALVGVITGIPQGRKEKPFSAFIDEYVQAKVNNEGTASLYRQTKNAIIEYSGEYTSFSDITAEWIDKFTEHRLSMGKKQNGISRNLRDIRAVFNYAKAKGYTKLYPFLDKGIPVAATAHRNMSVNDFRELMSYECLPFQEKYRDVFLLSFYLWGINIGDLLLLRHEDYYDGYIHYKRNKTHKEYMIKVEPEAKDILNRYRGKDYLLCFMDTNADYHSFLKHCNKSLQGIGMNHMPGKKPTGEALFPYLTTYYARHTIATFAAEIGTPMSTISMGLGHSMSGGALVTNTYVEFQQWQIDDCMRDVIDYIKSGKDARSFVKDKRLRDSGIADMLQKIYDKVS